MEQVASVLEAFCREEKREVAYLSAENGHRIPVPTT